MSNQELYDDISNLSRELLDMAKALSKMEPVSHLSKLPVRWNGGVIGLIQDLSEGKRLVNLINAPIYNGKSFYNICGIIMEKTKAMVELHNKMIPDEEFPTEKIQDIAEAIVNSVEIAHASWLQYSPDMANATIKIDEEEGELEPTLNLIIKEALSKLDLPPKYDYLKNQDSSESSGCLSVLILAIVSTMGLVGAGGYLLMA